MVVSTSVVARRYEDVSAGTPISVDIPAYEVGDVYVYYGNASLVAVQGTDYTVALAGDFETFTVTPTASLLTKINALIAGDPLEENYITVRRVLDYLTDATPDGVRYTPFTSREFDRLAMRDAQMAEKLQRTLSLSPNFVGSEPLLELKEVVAGATLIFDSEAGAIVAGPTAGDVASAQSYASAASASATAAAADAADAAAGAAFVAATVDILDGLTATVTELNYTDGVTGPIQAQIDSKQAQIDSKQAADATLTALAGLATGANKIPYSTGVDAFSQLDFKDEDDMASDSATAVPSQQSVKAYIDDAISGGNTLTGTGDAPFFGVRAWGNVTNYPTGTITINASGNVASVTRIAGPKYQVTFSVAMPDANYSVSSSQERTTAPYSTGGTYESLTTTGFIVIFNTPYNAALQEVRYFTFMVVR